MVSIPELKMSTNLKMHLKPSVQDVCQNLDSCIVHCRWYTVGEEVPKSNLGRLGCWLETEPRRSASGKVGNSTSEAEKSSRAHATRCKNKTIQRSGSISSLRSLKCHSEPVNY